MTPEHAHDSLLGRLLQLAEPAEPMDMPHLSPETLSEFTTGTLSGEQLDAAFLHLDRCSQCRSEASALVKLSSKEGEPQEDHSLAGVAKQSDRAAGNTQVERLAAHVREPASSWAIPSWATAAVVLIATGALVWWVGATRQSPGDRAYTQALAQLQRREFAAVDHTIDAARAAGVQSARLQSLAAESVRRIPGPVALAYRGKLTDFGFDSGGVVARDALDAPQRTAAAKAVEMLKDAGDQEVDLLLNRGHALLSIDQPQDAQREFQQAIKLAPENSLGWLGLGLAEFLRENYTAAEAAFKESARLAPQDVSPKINLALTLEELDRRQEALAMWREALASAASAADRQTIERAIHGLETEERKAP